jgi:hypothetical protein
VLDERSLEVSASDAGESSFCGCKWPGLFVLIMKSTAVPHDGSSDGQTYMVIRAPRQRDVNVGRLALGVPAQDEPVRGIDGETPRHHAKVDIGTGDVIGELDRRHRLFAPSDAAIRREKHGGPHVT